jgi:hypothetical protein
MITAADKWLKFLDGGKFDIGGPDPIDQLKASLKKGN